MRSCSNRAAVLVKDQGVGPSAAPGLVGDGEFCGVDPAVYVGPAVLGQRPIVAGAIRVGEECPKLCAQVASTAGR